MIEQFYHGSKPEVFEVAQAIIDKENPKKEYVRKPYEVPMPTIDSNPNVEGPIHMTKEHYESEKIKQQKKRQKKTKEAEIEVIQYLAREEMIRSKLAKLDPSKKKDAKKIAAYNVELKNIRDNIEMLQMQYGVKINELDRGTKIGRFMARLKRKATKVFRKVKEWFKRNKEMVIGVAAVIIPVLLGKIVGKAIA
ncbi:MAG: hypothetical protein NC548_13115 [Lachnospiraceae bacterium]|nr:hypothetical protein [Lachnospiraceae bacterium]MCM1230670.1 hypothetical protein [Ruminococcus flavefaciens]MCM1440446.1 hypothetical protein [Roseburia sp.]